MTLFLIFLSILQSPSAKEPITHNNIPPPPPPPPVQPQAVPREWDLADEMVINPQPLSKPDTHYPGKKHTLKTSGKGGLFSFVLAYLQILYL